MKGLNKKEISESKGVRKGVGLNPTAIKSFACPFLLKFIKISGDVGDQTRGLLNANKALYHWATSPGYNLVLDTRIQADYSPGHQDTS